MHGNCQYWFSNDQRNKKKLGEIVDRIKRYIRAQTFGLSNDDVKDIAQDTLLALVKCAMGILEKEEEEHILLSGNLDNPEFRKYLFVTAIHAAYKFNRNIKFLTPNQMERMQGIKYKKIYHEVYPTTDVCEEGESNHLQETVVDLEIDSLNVDAIQELAVTLKVIIDEALRDTENPEQQLFLKTVLFSKLTSLTKQTLSEFAANTGYRHSNYSGLVNRFLGHIYNSIVKKLDLPDDNNLKVFKKVIPDLLYVIKEVYPDEFVNLPNKSKV
ncbi:hypothetical protein [Vibrio vulnificus]|nr:hypothetical protein [Vibrio cholerae]EKF9234445.1 hypothetical protein [Vibrio cholerae]HAV6897885.1 hypothetical protein [Vibrio vulnificus]HCJ6893380.1 hypothetical protein [Vibrio cholerae]HDY7436655.1 hypothetical protein [Vibrio vulnificus]